MILYALIIRTKDGMALSATTDFNDEINKNIKNSKRYVKLVVKKVNHLGDRCLLHLGEHSLFLIVSLGVAYFVLCESSYPSVLAFSFLSELNREFISKYERTQVESAKRPYSFIEFDNFIHRARQRYNKPQSLTTKINLSELSTELRLRPPYVISLNEIEPSRNGFSNLSSLKLGVGAPARLRRFVWYECMACGLTLFSSFLVLLRALSTAHSSSFDFYPGQTHNTALFTFEAFGRAMQCYALQYYFRRRILLAWISICLVLACDLMLYDVRNIWQNMFYISITFFTHACSVTRGIEQKLPDYNV